MTPLEMISFFTGAAFTLGPLSPKRLPMTFPLLPKSDPATPNPARDGSFSETILISCGIRVGAVS